MAPGFAGYALGGFGSVNGTRGNQVNWQIDGADNNDWWHNIPAVNQGGVENIAGVTLPIDSIAEFSLQTQSSSEVGRNPGGTVNLVTKSGTNTFMAAFTTTNATRRWQPATHSIPSANCRWRTYSGERLSAARSGRTIPSGLPTSRSRSSTSLRATRGSSRISTTKTPRLRCSKRSATIRHLSSIPVDPATQKLLAILWPADLLATNTSS